MKMIQLGILGMVLAVGAQGASIAIANFSFEDNTPTATGCGVDCVYQVGLMSGWTLDSSGTDFGTWKPGLPANTLYFNSVPNGVNIGYAYGTRLKQVVGETALAGRTYTLEVELGKRNDFGSSGFGIVELVIGTTRVTATGVEPGLGNWSKYTASYAAVQGDTGKTIAIVLSGLDDLNNGIFGHFDNVRLNSAVTPQVETNPVPEPAGLGVVGLAGLLAAGKYLRTVGKD